MQAQTPSLTQHGAVHHWAWQPPTIICWSYAACKMLLTSVAPVYVALNRNSVSRSAFADQVIAASGRLQLLKACMCRWSPAWAAGAARGSCHQSCYHHRCPCFLHCLQLLLLHQHSMDCIPLACARAAARLLGLFGS